MSKNSREEVSILSNQISTIYKLRLETAWLTSILWPAPEPWKGIIAWAASPSSATRPKFKEGNVFTVCTAQSVPLSMDCGDSEEQ